MGQIRLFVAAAMVLGLSALRAPAQAVHFTRPTDTIRVLGETTLGASFTIEAVLLREPSTAVGGRVFAEQLDAQEDKNFYARPLATGGSVWSNGCNPSGISAEPIAAGRWTHLALVRDNSQLRLYVDGQTVVSSPVPCPTVNAAGSAMTLGAYRYQFVNLVDDAFIGYVDWLRVSSVARYSDPFIAPACEPGPDASTLLLFRFNEPPGSTTVADDGPSHFASSVGTGFPTATAPTFGPLPMTRLPVVIGPGPGSECVPGGAAFTVSGAGTGPFTYRWELETSPGVWATLGNDPMPLPCGGNASHALAQPFDGASTTIFVRGCPGPFRVRAILANSCGSTTGSPATLTISSADFNADGDVGTDADIEAFFACLAGHCCAACGTADFNGDGDTGTDGDIEAFFRVLAGGSC